MQKNNDKREKAFLVGVILKGSSRVQIFSRYRWSGYNWQVYTKPEQT